jgi:hypothetical protein
LVRLQDQQKTIRGRLGPILQRPTHRSVIRWQGYGGLGAGEPQVVSVREVEVVGVGIHVLANGLFNLRRSKVNAMEQTFFEPKLQNNIPPT